MSVLPLATWTSNCLLCGHHKFGGLKITNTTINDKGISLIKSFYPILNSANGTVVLYVCGSALISVPDFICYQ